MSWYPAPGKLNLFLHVLSKRADGFHVLLADSSVRYVENTIHPGLLAALSTVAGGEDLPPEW